MKPPREAGQHLLHDASSRGSIRPTEAVAAPASAAASACRGGSCRGCWGGNRRKRGGSCREGRRMLPFGRADAAIRPGGCCHSAGQHPPRQGGCCPAAEADAAGRPGSIRFGRADAARKPRRMLPSVRAASVSVGRMLPSIRAASAAPLSGAAPRLCGCFLQPSLPRSRARTQGPGLTQKL